MFLYKESIWRKNTFRFSTEKPNCVFGPDGFDILLLSDDRENNRRVLDETVMLHKAGPEDSGVYQCEASNPHGSVLANINVLVMSE